MTQLYSPSIPNGAIVNGVAHFVQSTKPLTRVDGSPLVLGDRWYKSDDGTEWFWNGIYWISRSVYSFQMLFGNYSGGFTGFANTTNITTYSIFSPVPVVAGTTGIFFDSVHFAYRAPVNNTCDGQLLVYGSGSLVRTIELSDFRLNRDRHRTLLYPINTAHIFTNDPLAIDATSVNFYFLAQNITSSIAVNRGCTTCNFRTIWL